MTEREREFNRKVVEIQNKLIPAAQQAAGHPFLPTELMAITKQIREHVADPSDRAPLTEIARLLTPKGHPSFTEAGSITSVSLLLEQAPKAAPPAPTRLLDELAKARRLIAEADAAKPMTKVQEEALNRCRVHARERLHRHLTAEEERDLRTAIVERSPGAKGTEATGHHAFGHAVMEGRLGPAKSPGVARPQTLTATQISEGAALVPDSSPAELKAHYDQLARLPIVQSDEGFHTAMAAFARTVPFGAQRLDQF